jgi:hypothetical protein
VLETRKDQQHYDLILASYETTTSDELSHLKSTPGVIIDRKAGASFNVGEGKVKRLRQGKRRRTEQMQGLARAVLADKIGYLHIEDFPDQSIFDDLPAQSYGPHKVIRCQPDELLLVRRGLVEI